ncbi:MAG: OmpH family outer membrane protein [Gemmatimonadetes bacterium]|nr:OmpH family outer membrane protein [Gemmatimonadota bacterium]
MRRTSLASLALATLLSAGAAEAQTVKIGYINSTEIVQSAPGSAQAQAQFDAELQSAQEEIQRLQTELQNLDQQLQQQQLTLSPEAKANRQQQLQVRVQEFEQRTAQLQEQANTRRAELVQPIMDQITEVIEALREEGNYAMILDAAAGSIISADPALDLTQEVLRRLEAAAAAAPGGGQ